MYLPTLDHLMPTCVNIRMCRPVPGSVLWQSVEFNADLKPINGILPLRFHLRCVKAEWVPVQMAPTCEHGEQMFNCGGNSGLDVGCDQWLSVS